MLQIPRGLFLNTCFWFFWRNGAAVGSRPAASAPLAGAWRCGLGRWGEWPEMWAPSGLRRVTAGFRGRMPIYGRGRRR